MDEEEFMRTNINTAYVIKVDLNNIKDFKQKLAKLVDESGADIIYHTVSAYKLNVIEDKQ